METEGGASPAAHCSKIIKTLEECSYITIYISRPAYGVTGILQT